MCLTCLCAYTTEPKSFQVPPLRSIRTIRRIWKKRRARNADAANPTFALSPLSTIMEAATVIMSATEWCGCSKRNNLSKTKLFQSLQSLDNQGMATLPIRQKGLLMNFILPQNPWYLDRHPDDHSLFLKPVLRYSKLQHLLLTCSILRLCTLLNAHTVQCSDCKQCFTYLTINSKPNQITITTSR